MSRRDAERLDDIVAAITAIRSHVAHGSCPTAWSSMRSASVDRDRRGHEALPAQLLETEPQTAWTDIARMRDRLAHRCFDTEHGFVAHAVIQELQPLEAAMTRLLERIRDVE